MESLLRVVSAGSVDDGKSTLLGRLLFDSGAIPEDQVQAVRSASKGFPDGVLDLSLVTDGLKAEREQKITIDVAYRYFRLGERHFILADSPGHVEYTRNFVTAASTADFGLLLVDAEQGPTAQTRRHLFLLSLLGVRRVLVVVNKMDRIGFDEAPFRRIEAELRAFAPRLSFFDLNFVPVSALRGDNVVRRSPSLPWFRGNTVRESLEAAYGDGDRNLVDFRLPIQGVIRFGERSRGYLGTVASGVVRLGDELVALPSGQSARVTSLGFGREEASATQAVTLELDRALDLGRGHWLVPAHNRPRSLSRFETMTVWMGAEPLVLRRRYRLKQGCQWVMARPLTIRYRLDTETLHRSEAAPPAMNEMARVVWETETPIYGDPYERNRSTGAAIVVDEESNRTVAALLLLDRPEPASEGAAKVFWITGLSGAGKSTLAEAAVDRLGKRGALAVTLDGDDLRSGLCSDLGYSPEDRAENVRRVAEMAKWLNAKGTTVFVALISPYAHDRERARQIVGADRFVEVFLDVPLAVCESRDAKGLYRKARANEIPSFTGISAPYERPKSPDIRISESLTLEAAVERLLSGAPSDRSQ